MISAVLDTSVLWPSLQRDFLLSLAVEGCYRPKWGSVILEELTFHEAQKLQKRHRIHEQEAVARAQRLVALMNSFFDDSLVVDWKHLEGTFGLPDVDDEHVLAVAVTCGAEFIVTENLKG